MYRGMLCDGAGLIQRGMCSDNLYTNSLTLISRANVSATALGFWLNGDINGLL